MSVKGQFQCISEKPLENVMISASLEDGDGKMIRSIEGFCTPLHLSKGDTGTFNLPGQGDDRITNVTLTFKTVQRAIKWSDKSGIGRSPLTARDPRWLLGSLLAVVAACTGLLPTDRYWVVFALWFVWFILIYRYRMGEWPG